MYMVVDTISRNVLGECESLVQAKALFLDLVSYQPSAATEIVILKGRCGDAPGMSQGVR